jgi:hypothetical protein
LLGAATASQREKHGFSAISRPAGILLAQGALIVALIQYFKSPNRHRVDMPSHLWSEAVCSGHNLWASVSAGCCRTPYVRREKASSEVVSPELARPEWRAFFFIATDVTSTP